MKIAAAYIRVSDERQDEYSPESQIKIIRDWASKNGFTVPEEHVYYDDGISGKSVEKRIQFNRMIAEAKDKRQPKRMKPTFIMEPKQFFTSQFAFEIASCHV